MEILLIIISGVICAAVGQMLWKYGMNIGGDLNFLNPYDVFTRILFNPYVLLGFLMYGLSALLWLIALSKKELSYVYPFMALTFIIIPITSRLIFNEEIPFLRIIGTLIIVLGIMLVIQS